MVKRPAPNGLERSVNDMRLAGGIFDGGGGVYYCGGPNKEQAGAVPTYMASGMYATAINGLIPVISQEKTWKTGGEEQLESGRFKSGHTTELASSPHAAASSADIEWGVSASRRRSSLISGLGVTDEGGVCTLDDAGSSLVDDGWCRMQATIGSDSLRSMTIPSILIIQNRAPASGPIAGNPVLDDGGKKQPGDYPVPNVIKALAESDAPYRIRGFTRDITKAASEALIKQGVEMIAISLVVDNVEEVNRVFAGVNYAFLVTNYWEHVNMEKEVSEGKMLIDAAKAAGVERLVWSGLVSPLKISSGKYTNVNHFDGKAEVTEYARQSGVPFVNVQAGLYATNFLGNPTMLAKQPDGTFAIAWAVKPTTVIPIIDAANDYGLFVRRVFELPVFPAGSEVYTSSEDITIEELARQLSEGVPTSIAVKTYGPNII
ncbi:NmrA-like family-domain-containing protein [Mycena latifolia]|nr:NmrA-like family-domain-containing protein [Mycena latifolia]